MDACCRSAAQPVYVGAFLSVTAGEQKRHRSGKFGLALFLGNLDVGGIELPITVGLDDAENVPDDLLLPVNKLEGFSSPGSFGMTKALDEHHGIIRCVHIVVGGFLHEPCGLVVFQFSRNISPPRRTISCNLLLLRIFSHIIYVMIFLEKIILHP